MELLILICTLIELVILSVIYLNIIIILFFQLLYMGVVLYAPSLALNQGTITILLLKYFSKLHNSVIFFLSYSFFYQIRILIFEHYFYSSDRTKLGTMYHFNWSRLYILYSTSKYIYNFCYERIW